MRHIAPKPLPNNNMPSGPILAIELLLNIRRDVLLESEFVEGGLSDIDRLLLHFIGHVDIFNDDLLRRAR